MEKPHISALTREHALEAANLTGIEYDTVLKTEYGYEISGFHYQDDFVFVITPKYTKTIRFGMAHRATDNIHLVCRFLEKHYTFD